MTHQLRRLIPAALLAVTAVLVACDDDDGGSSDEPTDRTFDDAGMDQHGCSRDEQYDPDSGLCEPGDCLSEAYQRQDAAAARGDDEAYNEAVEDANACDQEG